jgi:hypothetical protein
LKKNTDLRGKLDVDKWRHSGGGQVSRASSDKSDKSPVGGASSHESAHGSNGHPEQTENDNAATEEKQGAEQAKDKEAENGTDEAQDTSPEMSAVCE